jgi:ABC-2 type transport system ATP-binding protein
MANDTSDEAVIDVSNVSKQYDNVLALDDVTLSIPKGEMFGILGPNGAGKSTLFKILTTVSEPTSGTASIAGYDVQKRPRMVKEQISYIPQKTAVDGWQTGRQLLKLFATFYSVPSDEIDERCERALDTVDLLDAADRKIETYSGGMKRRLEIATTLVNRPSVVLLDEPTLGLDPQMRRNLWEYVRRIRSEGATLLIATHYLDEADALCDRVAILDEGKVVAVDEPAAMKQQVTDPDDRTLDRAFLEMLQQPQPPQV